MKSQHEFFLKSLACLPTLDFFNPGNDASDGGGATTDYDTVDFTMISSSSLNPGGVTNYCELKMESPAEGGTTPISADNETERVMLVMGLPKPSTNWGMSLRVNTAEVDDLVEMRTITGNYADLRSTLVDASNLMFEPNSTFFTIKVANGTFETYVNINQAAEVVKLSYGKLNTFDWFRVSFLAISNVAPR